MPGQNGGVSRRTALAAVGMAGAAAVAPAAMGAAPSPGQASLERAIEALRIAMVEGNGAALNALLHDHLNYMHSSAHSQTKQNLLNDLAGKRFFASLTYPEQSIDIVGNTGVVVQTIDQVKNLAGGKTRASRIKVLQTWTKTGGGWRLLTRSSHIISSPLSPACPGQPAG